MFSPGRVPPPDPAAGKPKRVSIQRSAGKKNKKQSPKSAKSAKKGTSDHMKIHTRHKMRGNEYLAYPPKPMPQMRERTSPLLRPQSLTSGGEPRKPILHPKMKLTFSSRTSARSSRLSVRSNLSSGSNSEFSTTMTDVFGTIPTRTHKTLLSRRSRSGKKKSSKGSGSRHTHHVALKPSSRSSARYSMRGSSRSKSSLHLRPPVSRSKPTRQTTNGHFVHTYRTRPGVDKIPPPLHEGKESPTGIGERDPATVADAPSGTAGVSTTCSSDSSLSLLKTRTLACQTRFEDDAYGPLYADLPEFIQRLREKRVAAATARGFKSSTRLHTSSRSTQTRTYMSKKKDDEGGNSKTKSGQTANLKSRVIRKLMRQQEEMLQTLAELNKDHRSSKNGKSTIGSGPGVPMRQLARTYEEERQHCESPDTDVYSEYNSPRSRVGDRKTFSRRRFNTEPRRNVSGRHVIPGLEEESSGDSDAGGNTQRSPRQRFSNVPPLNLAKAKISSMMTPRSYNSDTVTTRSSPDRSRKRSIGLSSCGAFNPLSGSARSGISSSRSLRSVSSLGVVLDDGKSNASFDATSEAHTSSAYLSVRVPSVRSQQ
ncbi:hypothetical protein AAMO2058_001453900 [Amorphochlora amoebiformis]|mmetsp:Transcript_34662/g.55920  ORF Transcript_34662/g.55920 Transcript_34662/m.55920 type:complete len:594 (-) Transcript_34662:497-2278(-)